MILLVYRKVTSRLMEFLDKTPWQAPAIQMAEFNENENSVTQTMESFWYFTVVCYSSYLEAVRFSWRKASGHRSSMKMALSWADLNIGLLQKKSRFVSLPSTAPNLMADVIVEDSVGETESGSGVEPCFAVRNSYKRLHFGKSSVFIVYEVLFERLLRLWGSPSRIWSRL